VITDPRIGNLPLTGAVDQFTDSTDATGDLRSLRAFAGAAILDEHRPPETRRDITGKSSRRV
jgi:hypothetical protein